MDGCWLPRWSRPFQVSPAGHLGGWLFVLGGGLSSVAASSKPSIQRFMELPHYWGSSVSRRRRLCFRLPIVLLSAHEGCGHYAEAALWVWVSVTPPSNMRLKLTAPASKGIHLFVNYTALRRSLGASR